MKETLFIIIMWELGRYGIKLMWNFIMNIKI
jgi:hypothetical protein